MQSITKTERFCYEKHFKDCIEISNFQKYHIHIQTSEDVYDTFGFLIKNRKVF